MATLKIQVLGRGLIPRGYGLAPRKNPFNADYITIGTILNTPGLKVNYVCPQNNAILPLTRENLKKVWDKWSNVPYTADINATAATTPHIPASKIDTPVVLQQPAKKEEPEKYSPTSVTKEQMGLGKTPEHVNDKAEETSAAEESSNESVPEEATAETTDEVAGADEITTEDQATEAAQQTFKPVNAPEEKKSQNQQQYNYNKNKNQNHNNGSKK